MLGRRHWVDDTAVLTAALLLPVADYCKSLADYCTSLAADRHQVPNLLLQSTHARQEETFSLLRSSSRGAWDSQGYHLCVCFASGPQLPSTIDCVSPGVSLSIENRACIDGCFSLSPLHAGYMTGVRVIYLLLLSPHVIQRYTKTRSFKQSTHSTHWRTPAQVAAGLVEVERAQHTKHNRQLLVVLASKRRAIAFEVACLLHQQDVHFLKGTVELCKSPLVGAPGWFSIQCLDFNTNQSIIAPRRPHRRV